MPNHVTNILSIADAGGVSLPEIRKAFMSDAGHIDFRVIKPSPKCLDDFEPSCGILSRAKAALGLMESLDLEGEPNSLAAMSNRLTWSNTMRDMATPAKSDDIPAIIRAIQNYQECGCLYWYDWNNEHWGTKWNAYEQPDDGYPEDATEFQFQTAWSHPAELIEELSRGVPAVTFWVRFADEDIGANCGTYSIKAGETFDEDIAPSPSEQTPEQRRKYTEMAFRVCNGDVDPASQGYSPDWEYSDEVYENYESATA